MFLSNKIKMLREQHQLSKNKLGEMMNMSSTAIRFLEQGKRKDPQLSTIVKIAKTFNLTVDELLEGTEFDLRRDEDE
ncbi:MAG: helix-turn-helix domain-containing protein [Clostridiaceae bacterium]